MIKLKMISVDHHLRLHQIPKNTKNILRPNKRSIIPFVVYTYIKLIIYKQGINHVGFLLIL